MEKKNIITIIEAIEGYLAALDLIAALFNEPHSGPILGSPFGKIEGLYGLLYLNILGEGDSNSNAYDIATSKINSILENKELSAEEKYTHLIKIKVDSDICD